MPVHPCQRRRRDGRPRVGNRVVPTSRADGSERGIHPADYEHLGSSPRSARELAWRRASGAGGGRCPNVGDGVVATARVVGERVIAPNDHDRSGPNGRVSGSSARRVGRAHRRIPFVLERVVAAAAPHRIAAAVPSSKDDHAGSSPDSGVAVAEIVGGAARVVHGGGQQPVVLDRAVPAAPSAVNDDLEAGPDGGCCEDAHRNG